MAQFIVTTKQAFGLTQEHLQASGIYKNVVRKGVITDLEKLITAAQAENLAIKIVSGYRSFDRQLSIWNAKATGQKPIYDSDDNIVNIANISDSDKVKAICLYSAIPGLSRHHWGTDFDIVDANVTNSEIQLTALEAETKYKKLHSFLDNYLPQTAFFRPYAQYSGKVAAEPWHISYQPIAQQYSKIITKELFLELLSTAKIQLKSTLINEIDYYLTFFN